MLIFTFTFMLFKGTEEIWCPLLPLIRRHIIGDANFSHLNQEVSAVFLLHKITINSL